MRNAIGLGVGPRALSVLIESEPKPQILVLTRFLHANRYPPTDQVRGHASPENALARLGSAIFLRRPFRLLIPQQSQDDFARRIGVRFRETFLEQGQVLPVNVPIHS